MESMNNDKLDIGQIIQDNKAAIMDTALASLQEAVAEKMRYAFVDHIQDRVKEFMEKEIAPEIDQLLMDNKESILEQLSTLTNSIGQLVSERLLETAVKNLSSEWDAKKVAKALFD